LGACRLLALWLRFPAARRAGVFFLDSGADVVFSRGSEVRIGRRVRFLKDTTLRVAGRLEIGDGSFFNRGCSIVVRDAVKIGQECLFGPWASIYDHDHEVEPAHMPPAQRGIASSPVTIDDNVWIGTKATILRGVRLGEGCVVAAHAVVTKDVAPFTLVAGVPARPIRDLRAGV
jgi:acetyltransferase-like isoleucine patch superfamily enzyme